MSTYLGIDIGNTAVKVAAIRTSYRKVQLVGLAAVEIVQAGDVATAIRNAVQTAVGVGGSFDGVATSIEGTKSTVRVLPLPASAHKQIGDVLPFELESALPFDIAEAVFDYRVLSGTRETKGEELSVLVGVAKTADVVSRIDLVKAASAMEPERVGLGAFPIANLVAYLPTLAEGVVALVDLGEASSDVLILKAGEPIFARTLGVGTRGLPASASKLARELRTTFASHRSQGGEPPARVLLCGGGAYTRGVEAFLSSAVEAPVEVLPAPMLEAVGIAPEQGAVIARFAKAIGLALSLAPRAVSLNLRKGPLAFERGFAWVKEKVPLLAGLAAVILVSFLFSVWAQLYSKSQEKKVLEAALGDVTNQVLGESTTESGRANDLLAQQTSLSDDDPLPHADAFDVMVKLSEAIPPSMTHDIEELDIQKGHVIVHGIVGSIPDAQAIRSTLANEKCFSDPKITRTTAQVGGTAQKYVLEFDLKCPEDVKGGKKSSSTAATSASAAPSVAGGK
ncbi:Type IV pilus biogenesis protein PilM [Labilithrix luteola]|uniref:Type IV pilus biogenesis protein PilM n=1 Tax=Labilithrix luteola TaxID=1391654 RepID=A0A0K1Q6N1_9BACT|nr:pilus assembly protein PilM [Labilithrix luteola]AKV01302.1 Type IV pilus biogenesis protein PilM [Labilithrix luteola]